MSVIYYDLILLGIFIVLATIFYIRKRKNFTREGIFLLYKTSWGVKFIDLFAKKFERILKPLRYVVITSGGILTISIIWLIAKTTHIYLTTPFSTVIRAPPVAPIIPYFPSLFGLDSFFPQLYFSYFLIALIIIATVHEFSHGIFTRLEKLKVKSTGFGFLGPIPVAFVEPDEKEMAKAKKFPQMSILAAGTFANIIATVFFGVLLAIFFAATFSPAGIHFQTYATTTLNTNQITQIENSTLENYNKITSGNKTYFIPSEFVPNIQELEQIPVYENTPALQAQLQGAIVEIQGEKITNMDELQDSLSQLSPKQEIQIKTAIFKEGYTPTEFKEYTIELAEKDNNAYLGIQLFPETQTTNPIDWFYAKTIIQQKTTYYDSTLGEFGWFIYYLLWWIVLINFLVALFNMLPLGVLDGGRFFYLGISGITKSEKIGKTAYKIITWLIILVLVALMLKWAAGFF